jgi:hypothetical protein
MVSNSNVKKNYKNIGFNRSDAVLNFNPNSNSNFLIHLSKKKKIPNSNPIEKSGPLPKWFDWNYYINTYTDLRDAGINTPESAFDHWLHHGEREGRECMYNFNLFKKYPNLFHKYLLGISKSDSPMTYDIVSEKTIQKKYICSIHCFDLKNFGIYFNQYISKLDAFFDFVVTYVHDFHNVQNIYNFTFIKMENKGMDIGSKFITVNYLKSKNIDYEYVFFVHSKSNSAFRNIYMKTFIVNLDDIIKNMNSFAYDGMFNYLIHNNGSSDWGRNSMYMNEIISYLDLDRNYFMFPEGNFYILRKNICEILFSDEKIYNCLNRFNDFDYSWVKNYYKLNGNCNEIYDTYIKGELYGNNMETNIGHNALADCMIEHTFERIIFLTFLKYNKTIYIYKNAPQLKMNSSLNRLTASIIACHTNNQMKINTIVNNIHYLNKISDIIYIVDTASFANNNLIASIQSAYPDACINYELTDEKTVEYVNENPDLCHMNQEEAKQHFKYHGYRESHRLSIFSHFIFVSYCPNYGYCYGKWLHYFDKIDKIFVHNNYILTNDSFLITNALDKFNNLINENNYDIISMSASNQYQYHYTDFLRAYNNVSVKEYISFVRKQLTISTDFLNVIKNIEIPSVGLFLTRGCVYDAEPGYNDNINFDDEKLFHYLNDLNYPIVKIKKINGNFYLDSRLPEDFNEDIYKNMHVDLINIPDPVQHFLKCGIPEGRLYKPNQHVNINPKLKEYLLNYVRNNASICNIDFENYTA